MAKRFPEELKPEPSVISVALLAVQLEGFPVRTRG
jgi:hypothetical protein